ncbi:MAG: hypothetical protein HYX57_11105 [Chloroflexi bacterium]|nr:hypothetical protein [Chloroflexota bacterium]
MIALTQVHADLRRDPLVRDAIGSADHDPGPLREPLLARPGADQTVENRPFIRTHDQLGRGRMGHATKRSCDHHNGLVTSVLGHQALQRRLGERARA